MILVAHTQASRTAAVGRRTRVQHQSCKHQEKINPEDIAAQRERERGDRISRKQVKQLQEELSAFYCHRLKTVENMLRVYVPLKVAPVDTLHFRRCLCASAAQGVFHERAWRLFQAIRLNLHGIIF